MLRVSALVACSLVLAARTLAEDPRVFVLDVKQLLDTRQRVAAGDAELRPAIEQLTADADVALSAGPYSVVDKEVVPPSGDKHDYMSQAPYWWPNPDTKTGLPYIRRDGERNPEIHKLRNRLHLGEMSDNVEALALAWFFTGEKRYAGRATTLLRTWFLDPATRMNPHLKFGQGIPGINTGRGIGLIETRTLVRVVDSIGLLAGSDAWTDADQRGMQQWFTEFLDWMLRSEYGRDEAAAENNHGTYYDVQVISFALFLDQHELATEVLREVGKKRIALQVRPDGRQPLELARTKAWSYSVGNLAGLMTLARLGEHADIDLWNFKTDEGAGIRAALDFLVPFGTGRQEWRYPQINGFEPELLSPLLRIAAAKYPDAQFRQFASRRGPIKPTSRSHLVISPLEPISRLHTR